MNIDVWVERVYFDNKFWYYCCQFVIECFDFEVCCC